MSRSPQSQRRDIIRNAKMDKRHAEKRLAEEESKTGKATFQRAIDKQNKIIRENKR